MSTEGSVPHGRSSSILTIRKVATFLITGNLNIPHNADKLTFSHAFVGLADVHKVVDHRKEPMNTSLPFNVHISMALLVGHVLSPSDHVVVTFEGAKAHTGSKAEDDRSTTMEAIGASFVNIGATARVLKGIHSPAELEDIFVNAEGNPSSGMVIDIRTIVVIGHAHHASVNKDSAAGTHRFKAIEGIPSNNVNKVHSVSKPEGSGTPDEEANMDEEGA